MGLSNPLLALPFGFSLYSNAR